MRLAAVVYFNSFFFLIQIYPGKNAPWKSKCWFSHVLKHRHTCSQIQTGNGPSHKPGWFEWDWALRVRLGGNSWEKHVDWRLQSHLRAPLQQTTFQCLFAAGTDFIQPAARPLSLFMSWQRRPGGRPAWAVHWPILITLCVCVCRSDTRKTTCRFVGVKPAELF